MTFHDVMQWALIGILVIDWMIRMQRAEDDRLDREMQESFHRQFDDER